MNTIRLSLALAALSICSAMQHAHAEPTAAHERRTPAVNIGTAQRALPTKVDNVRQPAHFQHVYLNANGAGAGSIETITLQDADANGLLVSSDLQVKALSPIDPSALAWVIFDQDFPRPTQLEGVGGAGVAPKSFADVHFALNESEILDRAELDKILKTASRVDAMFYVVGYADETGLESKNLTLSQDRAKAVADALVAGGVNRTRVKFFGAGVSRTFSDLSANRRASIALIVNQ